MAVTIATAANYWISPTALSITLNALGEANRIQASVASGSAIVCYIRGIDGLGYDNGHNYRRWPLAIMPTYFDTNDEIYLYVAIPRSEAIGTDALVVFPRQLLDIEGYAVVTDPDTGEQTRGTKIGSDDYYFIWLQGIITSSGTGYTPREWRETMQTGTLATDEAIDSQEGTWYRWDPVSQTVTFLKEILMDSTSWFRNLIARSFTLNGTTLNGVAVKGETPTDSDDTIVTPAYLEGIGDDKYLRKDQDDFTPYSLGVGGNLSVQGIFDAIEAKIDKMRSHNYSGSGLGDTGWLLTSDDGTGASLLEIDKLLVRMKATFMELEIRKETFSGGNNHYSPAGSVIYRVDFMTVDNQPLGYRVQKVPWLLKGIGWLFRMKSYTRQRRIRYAYTLDQLTEEERRQVAKFRCYLISDDGTTATRNWWQVGDQPRCQSFNKALSRDNKRNNIYDTTTAGVTDPTSPISSDFWWRLVTEVGTQILDDDKVYDFIEVPYEHYSAYEDEYRRNPDNFCAAGSDIPKAGDTIVCMGNRTDPARMNLVSIISVSTTDFGEAPAVKGYRGIHRFSLDGCLVFNISPAKVSIRSKSFEFLADNGDAFPVPLERGEWTLGLRYHWYDRVSHNGSIWLCQISDTKVWVNQAGNNIGTPATADIIEGEGEYTYTAGSAQIPSLEGDEVITGTDHYYRRGMIGSQMVYEVQAWTYDEPTDTNANWLKEVGKGTEITDSIIRYNASLSGTINPDEDPTGATHPSGWKETIAATGIKAGQYLWTRRTTYYSDNRTPTVEYSVARWGIDGDGISEIDSYYWATTEPITMTPAYDEAHILPWDAGASQSAKKGMWAPTFSDLETVWGGIGKMQAMYVWEKTVIKYDMAPDPEGQPVTKPDLVSYQCNRIGNDGLIGEEEYYMLAESDDFATVFGSTTPAYTKIGIRWYNQTNPAAENYRLSDTQPNIDTQMWSPLMPAYDKATHGAKIYLWNFEQRVDGTGTQYATRPVCIGNHARGIKGVRELYACSAFGVPQTGRQFPNDIYDASAQHPESDINVWTDEIYNRAPNEAYPYQWNWTRTLYSSPRNAQDTDRDTATGYFYEDVFHVSAVRGTNGEDGAGEETIYKRNNTGTTPDTPPNSGKGTLGGVYKANWTAEEVAAGDDWVPDGWTDNPLGIDYSNQYEYESKRRLGSPDSQGRKQWGALSAPKLRSRWGRNGQDGDGTEYVYIRTKNNVAPTFAVNDGGNATDYKSQEWLPYINNKDACDAESNRCTDDPKDISREWPYEWCAKRTMADPDAQTGVRLWKSYYECTDGHKMSLWKNFSENSMRLDISNEMDMVQTDSAGKVIATRTVSTIVRFFDGAKEVTLSTGDITASGASKSQSGNGVSLSWTYTAGNTFTGAEITISYTYLSVTYRCVFTVAASMGQPVYQLKPSHSALPCTRNADNTLGNPPALSLIIVKVDGSSTSDMAPGDYGRTYIRYSTTSMPTSSSSGTAWPSSNSVQAANTDDNVYIAIFNSNGILLDRETIPVLKDGKNGDKGQDGSYYVDEYARSKSRTSYSNIDTSYGTNGWGSTAPAATSTYPYIWKRSRLYNPNTGTYGSYSYVCLTGEQGPYGEDAPYEESEYARSSSSTSYSNTYIDGGASGWYSEAPLPTTTYPFIWKRTRVYYPSSSTYGDYSYVRLTGTPGNEGKAGRWYDYAGIWGVDVSSVTNTANVGYYVLYYYSGTNKHFYMNTKADGTANTTTPADSTGSANDGWELISDDREYYIVKAVFGDYAQFGSFIINGDWLISTQGVVNVRKSLDVPFQVTEIASFVAKTSGTHRLNISLTKSASMDVIVRICSSSGTTLASTTISGTSTSGTVSYSLTAGTTYTVRIDKSTSSQTATADITMSTPTDYLFFNGSYPQGEGTCTFCPNFAVDGKTGKTYQNDAYIKGEIHATSGTFNNVTATNINIKGSTRSPFTFVNDNGTFNDQFTDNMSVRSTSTTSTTYNIPWDTSQSGKKITITNWKDWNGNESNSSGYAKISAPSGKYFFEDGVQKSSLKLSREAVELIGYGNDDVFFGWAVLKRIDLGTQYRYGHHMKMLAVGTVQIATTDDHTPSFLKKESFDGTTLSVSRIDTGIFKVTWNNNSWFANASAVFAMVCGYGTEGGISDHGPIYASVKETTTTSFTVQVADDDSRNDGGFSFFLMNLEDWIYLHD